MGASFVRTTGKSEAAGATIITASFAALPAAGNFILVQVVGWSNTGVDFDSLSCYDNQNGSPYTRALQSVLTDTIRVAIFFLEATAAPSGTHTVTVDPVCSGAALMMVATEWSGLAPGSLDVYVDMVSTSSGQPFVGPTSNTAQSDELIAAVFTDHVSQSAITPEVVSPVWDVRCEELDGASWQVGQMVTRVVNVIEPQGCQWTVTTPDAFHAALATFKVTPGADSSDIFRFPSA